MEGDRRRLFVSYLNTYGTDFSYIRQTPEFSGWTDAALLQLYTEHLEQKAQHISVRGEESNIRAISKIFRDRTCFRALVETEEESPRGGSRLLRLDDYRLPFLLKDREYFLKQQLSFVHEIYGLMEAKGIVSREFAEEPDPVRGTDSPVVDAKQDGGLHALSGDAASSSVDPEESDSLSSFHGAGRSPARPGDGGSEGEAPPDACAAEASSRTRPQSITKSKLIINKKQKTDREGEDAAGHGVQAADSKAAETGGKEEENLFSDYLSASRSLGRLD